MQPCKKLLVTCESNFLQRYIFIYKNINLIVYIC
jgi:hypothetical protein